MKTRSSRQSSCRRGVSPGAGGIPDVPRRGAPGRRGELALGEKKGAPRCTLCRGGRSSAPGGSDCHALRSFDGDGHQDLATGSVEVLLNQGDGNFEGSLLFSVSGNSFSSFTGDLDGDGDPDLTTATGAALPIRFNFTVPPRSSDENGNRIPDECEGEPRFRRGDANFGWCLGSAQASDNAKAGGP